MSPRRGAVAAAVAASAGLAALTDDSAQAQSRNNDVSADRRRGKRGKRGKNGRNGRQGPAGPPAGAGLTFVEEECTAEDFGVGDTHGCTATCPAGTVASGGGFTVGPLLGNLAIIRGSAPDIANDRPVGWEVTVEFLDIGQDFDYSSWALCVTE